ncbi:hypothetical protein LMH87_000051 [Akanthomyces muscarius]|uniref:ABC transporter domain-containing protein n=1 Tax=Akanthomyces muscarius TaxID=2231603 RepID=A0A9W8QG11_AKAMU|nr:hypothetical protein LMH87_000051 [Akanthomyces muscarius]KAJ4154772.1 hypothetical protein LMH87_000051 [Akanthomyces muscarius]
MDCTSTQTRFHVETTNYRQINIDGEGKQYNLVGRNGTGKSSLLRAIGAKLIPGIPQRSKIVFLEQFETSDVTERDTLTSIDSGQPVASATTVDYVVECVASKNLVERDVCRLTEILKLSSPRDLQRELRLFKLDHMKQEHLLLQKEANMRSGDRGLAARKDLVSFEKNLAAFELTIINTDEPVSSKNLQDELFDATEMLAALQVQAEPTDTTELEAMAKRFLLGLGFTEDTMKSPPQNLSGGWKMRADLAIALLQDCDILILDEPTNFLDIFGIIWLQGHLLSLRDLEKPPTVILVSHDRAFTNICTDLIVLKDKSLSYYHGTLSTYEAAQSEKRGWLIKLKAAQDKQIAHMTKTIAQNLKAGKEKDDQNKIRQAKSRQLRVDDRTGMQVNSKGHKIKRCRDVRHESRSRDEIEIPPEERQISIVLPLPSGLRFPGTLLSLEEVSYRYSTGSPMINDGVTLTVSMGDRIGILGLNGSGKSTLVRLLVGEAQPTKGTITKHPRLRLAYYAQDATKELTGLANADSTLTALSLLLNEVEGALDEGEVRGVLSAVGLPGRLASDVRLGDLSGGQMVRCQLARLLWRCPQCLVLDEVTTHLDFATVTALRDALRNWPGAVILVTHDRWFMRGVIEGQFEEDEENSADSDSELEAYSTRRAVYRIHEGKLAALPDGVAKFEQLVEREVAKYL